MDVYVARTLEKSYVPMVKWIEGAREKQLWCVGIHNKMSRRLEDNVLVRALQQLINVCS